MRGIHLHDYQTEMLARIKEELADRWGDFLTIDGASQLQGKSLMVQMPTGTGKTYLMAAVVKYFMC